MGKLKALIGGIAMKMTKEEYAKLEKKNAPKSTSFIDCLYAFTIGGTICMLGEIMHTIFVFLNFSLNNSSLMVNAGLICLSALATSLGLYQKLAAKAGAGTLVPITGFANAVVAPAIEYRCEGLITGVGAKMFLIAGPVVVYGTIASFIWGVIYYFLTLGGVNI